MSLNQTELSAGRIQAEWKTGLMSDKIKLITRAEKLGTSFVPLYQSTDELADMMNLFEDRELKISFLKGFEAGLQTGLPITEETKSYIYYEKVRNKR